VTDLVMLHGWGTGASTFEELSQHLSLQFEVSAPDLPGYGASLPCEPYTLEEVAACIAAHAPAHCFVVGWSLGAQVALEWARAKPAQVERLALMGATPCFVQRSDWPCAMEPEVFDDFSSALTQEPDATLARFAALQALGDAEAKRVTRTLRQALAGRPLPQLEVLAEGLHMLRETDLRTRLASVGQPALVLQGECDRLVPGAAGAYLARMLGDGTLSTVAGAAHAPFVSNVRGVAHTLSEFFA
jgi:pimeloyl-[acyl-carrier protein] methyl ester esterase